MCGRFGLFTPPETVARHFELDQAPDFEPRWNIAPTQKAAVVRVSEDTGLRQLSLLRWGLIPGWAKDMSIGYKMINARSETLMKKPAFRGPVRRRRCLIPADGFFEWARSRSGKKPFFIRPAGGGLWGFAGLWERWSGPEETVESFTIITTEANEAVRTLHDRMPVILPLAAYDQWLDPDLDHPESLQSLLIPFPSQALEIQQVSSYVNKPGREGPQCIEPIPAGQMSLLGPPG